MELEEAIRTRRTHKAYGTEPVDRETLAELLELGALGAQPPPDEPVALPRPRRRRRWRGSRRRPAPEAGRQARPRADARRRLGRAAATTRWPTRRTCCATACAAYIVLLAAHGRGLAGYWRTPAVLRTARGPRRAGHRRRRARHRPAAPRPRAPGAARARARARRATSSATWTDALDAPAGARHELGRRDREDRRRRPGRRPHRLVGQQVLVDDRLDRRARGRRAARRRSRSRCARGRRRRRPSRAPKRASSTRLAPEAMISSGASPTRKTSDLQIAPDLAADGGRGVGRGARARRELAARPRSRAALTPRRSAPARRSPRRSAGSGRRRCCRPP